MFEFRLLPCDRFSAPELALLKSSVMIAAPS
jgi:hypothetical protein